MTLFIILLIGLVFCDLLLIYLSASGYCFGTSNKFLKIFCNAGLGEFLMAFFCTGLVMETYKANLYPQSFILGIAGIAALICAIIKLTDFISNQNPHFRV